MGSDAKISRVLALAMCFIMVSGLAAFMSAPVISADTELRADWIELDYDPTLMIAEATYHIDSIDLTFFCLGEGDGVNDDTASTCTIDMVVNVLDDDVDNLLLNISQYSDSAFDFNDPDTTTDQIEGVRSGPANPVAGNSNSFRFMFDVLATSTLGTPSARDLTIRYWYWDENAAQERSDTLSGVAIYISSIFDNPANDPDEQLANAVDASGPTDDAPFEAGDMFEATTIQLQNYDASAAITDIEATVTEPGSGVTLSGGRNVCSIPAGITAGNNANLLYRTDVAVGTPPGVYSATVDIAYTRDDSDLTVTEDNLGCDWEVDFAFADDDPVDDGDRYSEFQCRAIGVNVTDADVSDDNVTKSDENLEVSPEVTGDEVYTDPAEGTLTEPQEEGTSSRSIVWILAPIGIITILLGIGIALLLRRRS